MLKPPSTPRPIRDLLALGILLTATGAPASEPTPAPAQTLFTSVRICDGKSAALINGPGRTLMPGLIDAHPHIVFSDIPMVAALTSDIGFVNVAAGKAADARGIGLITPLASGPEPWP